MLFFLAELKKHLKTLRLSMMSSIDFPPHATTRSSSIETYLTNLVKQGFLDKIRLGTGGAPQPTQGECLDVTKTRLNADLDLRQTWTAVASS